MFSGTRLREREWRQTPKSCECRQRADRYPSPDIRSSSAPRRAAAAAAPHRAVPTMPPRWPRGTWVQDRDSPSSTPHLDPPETQLPKLDDVQETQRWTDKDLPSSWGATHSSLRLHPFFPDVTGCLQ